MVRGKGCERVVSGSGNVLQRGIGEEGGDKGVVWWR